MIPDWPEDLVAVAKVLRPQGNRGQVKAEPLTSRLDRFGELGTVTVWKDGAGRALTLTDWRSWRGFVILSFSEVTEIGQAETLRGALLCVPAAERAHLPPGEYYHDDLLGLAVTTGNGQPLGRITSIVATKANDVLVVGGADGHELLLPAVRSVVKRVDLAAGFLVVELLPGLVDQGHAN